MPKVSGPRARRGRPRKAKPVAAEVVDDEVASEVTDEVEANGDGSENDCTLDTSLSQEIEDNGVNVDEVKADILDSNPEISEKKLTDETELPTSEESKLTTPEESKLPTSEESKVSTSDESKILPTPEESKLPTPEESELPTSEESELPTPEESKLTESKDMVVEDDEDYEPMETCEEESSYVCPDEEGASTKPEIDKDNNTEKEEKEDEKKEYGDMDEDNEIDDVFKNEEEPIPSATEINHTSVEDGNAEKLSEVSEQQEDFEDDEKPKQESESLDHETEMVSEDELPSENIKPPLDTEAVSDEELPPTHLLDTEAVSEDELPPVKKKKSESINDAPKSSSEPSEEDNKKGTLKRSSGAVNESDDEIPSKKAALESKSSNKSLPELDKYWKAVKEDPADFTGWTYLLQYVDQEHDVEAAREAYDTFLSHYPYCYGYWRKYADYEKKKGDKSRSQEVFEKGLAAIPLSVDLWLHYLNHIKNTRAEDEDYIREQYKRAIDVCGIEFRSDRLWDNYIKWEMENKNYSNVCAIFDKLFTIPTQGYKTHFEKFEDFVMSNQPNKMLGVDEFLTMRADVLQKLRQKPPSESAPAANAPPGDESDDEAEKSLTYADEETKLMREKIIASRKKIFKSMSSSVLDRWTFEEGIKRPYFHVKPLERCQLNNWRSYLEYEINQGDKERTVILFERCLIACALYDEFWVKYIRYLETLTGPDIIKKIRNVYERACTIHHPKKPMLALNWAYFEENQGDAEAARKILARIEKEVPNSLQIAICRINLERRSNNLNDASQLYEHYISTNKNKYSTNALSIKYARFCQKILNDVDKGTEVLKKAIEKDKDNPRLYHQLLDLVFSKVPRGPEQESECLSIINQFLERDTTDIEHKVLFAQHKIEFLEDFGSSVECLQKAVSDYVGFLKQVKEKRRKQYEEKMKQDESKKKGSSESAGGGHNTGVSSSPSANYSQTSYSQSSYTNSNSSNQYQTSSSSYGQPYNQYNSQSDPNFWNYSQTGYNNYNQGWGSYNYY